MISVYFSMKESIASLRSIEISLRIGHDMRALLKSSISANLESKFFILQRITNSHTIHRQNEPKKTDDPSGLEKDESSPPRQLDHVSGPEEPRQESNGIEGRRKVNPPRRPRRFCLRTDQLDPQSPGGPHFSQAPTVECHGPQPRG